MSQTFDVIVIGAGIMGCSTALELAKRDLKVAVLEKSVIGVGSTGKSSAIIRQHYSNETTARMALHSLRVFQNFDEQVGGDCGFVQTGFLAFVPESDVGGLRENIALQQRVGIQTEILSRDDIQEMWPDFVVEDLIEAAYEPESGYADPNDTLNAFAAACRRLGVAVLQETEVTGIRMTSGKAQGVDTPTERFDAPKIVNCAGAWGAKVAELAGMTAPINSCRVQVGFFKRPPTHQSGHPVVADFVNAVYWRVETGGLSMVGLIDPEEEDYIVDPDNFNESVDFDFIHDAGERFVRRYPAMEASESTGGFAALYGITPDWHPIIDEPDEGSGIYICGGFSGHGFKLGPAVGLITADMITGQVTPDMDRNMFRLSRYEDGEPVRGQYEYSIVG
jgi:sarcosine oxidase subunit beta